MTQISVVLPTHNRKASLERVLKGLETQTVPYERFEVIVVSDGSTDGTNQFLEALKTPLRVTKIIQQNKGVAAARNAGAGRACGDLILFVDDDVFPTDTLLEAHMRRHEAAACSAVVIGPMLSPDGFAMKPWVRWEQAMLMKQYDAMQKGLWEPTARQFYTGNSSLPRSAFVESGGFDTGFRRAEDVELGYRLAQLGLKFIFAPEAVGFHYADRSFESWFSTPYAYGRNDAIFWRDRGQHWLLPTVAREFAQRNRLNQFLVTVCLDRPVVRDAFFQISRSLARIGTWSASERLEQTGFSAIFSVQYYQGLADELGGRDKFLNSLGKPDVSPG